jgi:hypothetical protein
MKFASVTTFVALTVMMSIHAQATDDATELRERAIAMRHEAAELLAKGHDEESNRLTKQSMELLEKAHQVASAIKHNDVDSLPEIAELHERLRELHSAYNEAKASKSEDRVRELEQKIEQTKLKLAYLGDRRQPGELEGVAKSARIKKLELATRRIRHMRMAAENLKAAELHDLAHEVMKKAEGLERDVHVAREEMERATSNKNSDAMEKELQDLRRENERLRNALNELSEEDQE